MKKLHHALEQSHKDIYQWFLFHQECLLLGEQDYAAKALAVFTELLSSHLQFENEHLLTQEEALKALRWPVLVYRKEHDKVLAMLAKIQQQFNLWQGAKGRHQRLYLLELLDAQLSFRNVVEHHEQREEQDLFVQLSALSDQEASLMAAFEDGFAALKQSHEPLKETLKAFLAAH